MKSLFSLKPFDGQHYNRFKRRQSALLKNIKNKDKFIAENENELNELAKKMADRSFSFRNLEYIVNEAKSNHLQDRLKDKNAKFKMDYLRKAEESLKKSDGELEGK